MTVQQSREYRGLVQTPTGRGRVRMAACLLAGLACLGTACQTASRPHPVPPVTPVTPAPPRAISPMSDSRASYHFLIGYQAELEQETERAIKEYQLALQTDASSNYLKARLAVLYFT